MKIKEDKFFSQERKEFLLSDDFKAFTWSIDYKAASAVMKTENGRSFIPAGTILPKNDATAQGILLETLDITGNDGKGYMVPLLQAGIVNVMKLPDDPSAEAKAALKLILFKVN